MTNLEKAIDEAAGIVERECFKMSNCESCPVGTICEFLQYVDGIRASGNSTTWLLREAEE